MNPNVNIMIVSMCKCFVQCIEVYEGAVESRAPLAKGAVMSESKSKKLEDITGNKYQVEHIIAPFVEEDDRPNPACDLACQLRMERLLGLSAHRSANRLVGTTSHQSEV